MSAYRWTPERRADLRDRASRATGSILWPDAVLSLLDDFDAAEARGALAEGLAARLDAASALHRPVARPWGMGCASCSSASWPCDTAEALSARSETP